MNSPSPAWYQDPSNPSMLRYWDGSSWTDQTQPAPPPSGFAPPPQAAPRPPYMQQSAAAPNYADKPETYLVWAILTTLFCCLPFGIVSIINAAKVDSAWAQGQYLEAAQRSASAKKWAIWAAVAGGVVAALYFIAVVVIGVGIAGSTAESSI